MTRITEKDYAALTGKKTPRDSSHERDAPEAERMPAHVHASITWTAVAAPVRCKACGAFTRLLVKFHGGLAACPRCTRCPECHKTARQLWEAANKR